jgi:two-component system sensor histidine kinase ArlS
MPVRLRITLLFLLIVMLILGLLCTGIYFFTYENRLNTINTRLLNRAHTTERFLSDREVFDEELMLHIDSLTLIAISNKAVQAFDAQNRIIYSYKEDPADTIAIQPTAISMARKTGVFFFASGNKEAVAFCNVARHSGLVVVASGEDIDGKENLRSVLKILLASFLAGNLLIIISGYFFSGRLLEPVQKIASDVAVISAQNLTRRIKTGKSKDEWYQLANTLNLLLDRLQESFELQTRFISNASHELSTPLTSISSQLEVSLQRERDGQEYRKVMESIYQDVRHMSKLTQTLLEFAKASGSPTGLDIKPLRIDEIILAMPADIMKLAPGYTVALDKIELPEEEEELLVFGNEALLHTAIRNIVINACKYSENNKAIIGLEVKDKIMISVTDQGKGINQSDLNSIFQPFYRAPEISTGHGFGLGLSLTDRIIKLHKGRIDVHSVSGKGTRFTIILPHARAYN